MPTTSACQPPRDELRHAAQRFYLRHQGEHLSPDRKRLIGRCVQHLSEAFGVSQRAAEDAALLAFAEHEARDLAAYIDLDRSTSYAVIVADPARGKRLVLTARDLLELARQRGTAAVAAHASG
ncbi:MAG: hypothetical protein KatS3mg127_1235 [Silanimonas sp.]|nr:MAG: hypothetical protein KatS3mg127_1235 [Silanimonas sp.]